jgi:uncharacterized membrane protein YvbJ
MKCPKCGHENREGAEFCGVCGQSLETERTCPQCGHVNPKDFKFCNKCGQPLVSTHAPPSVSAPPSPIPNSFAGRRY